jgi:glucose-6-phosphate isomerase
MNDAGNEAKLQSRAADSVLRSQLGKYANAVQSALAEADQANIIRRIWDKDASVWKTEPAHQKIIANSLGWLRVASGMSGKTDELKHFADRIRQEGYQQVMVCGMGGSSLCPEVLRQTFGASEGFPTLLVLDSTDPDVINNFRNQIDISRCLFVIASKSGTTTEPVAFHRYWYGEVSRLSDSPGDSFIAITDPGTQMASVAEAEGFKHIFLNQPDIGGRYSALSHFGMVPAALLGIDIDKFLQNAIAMADLCKLPATQNPAAMLGAAMAESALAGRDKLTIIADEKLASVGLWIEQLVAESTGKEGKGIVPIVLEEPGDVSKYGDDRAFVSISLGEPSNWLQQLEDAGHPIIYRSLGDIDELGGEFFLWEMATAFAGWRLAINPFDQPNVQEAKDATKTLLDSYSKEGKLSEQDANAHSGEMTVYGTGSANTSFADLVHGHLKKAGPGDYIALLAYLEETPEIDAALTTLRTTLRDLTGRAVTSGYGPRYLHSTGQLHKGGPDSGVFVEITAPDQADFDVPQSSYSFSVLKQAQAQGDLDALLAHGRRALRINLGNDIVAGLRQLTEIVRTEE